MRRARRATSCATHLLRSTLKYGHNSMVGVMLNGSTGQGSDPCGPSAVVPVRTAAAVRNPHAERRGRERRTRSTRRHGDVVQEGAHPHPHRRGSDLRHPHLRPGDLGPRTGVPVVFITHLAAVLDNWDPRVVDGIAARHRVITFDNRGVGASSGSTPKTIEEMAKDAVTFIRGLGLEQVDIHGFSMGGMIAQVIAQDEPRLVRRLILTGTGPAGGEGIKNVTRLSHLDTVRALFTLQDPKQFLFFTRTAGGRRAGKQFLARLKERTHDRDKAISPRAYLTQLKAIHRWGLQAPADLSAIHQPVLVANGDNDRMVPTVNSVDL